MNTVFCLLLFYVLGIPREINSRFNYKNTKTSIDSPDRERKTQREKERERASITHQAGHKKQYTKSRKQKALHKKQVTKSRSQKAGHKKQDTKII